MEDSEPVVYLESIMIDGYRSCRGTHFQPNPSLSALIGINGAGKTNILNAINLLPMRNLRSWSSKRQKEEVSSNETSITSWFFVNGNRVGLRLNFVLLGSNRGIDEVVRLREQWSFPDQLKNRQWVEFPSFLFLADGNSGRHVEHEIYMAERMYRMAGGNISNTKELKSLLKPEIKEAVRSVNKFRNGIKYYSASQFTDPTKCPSNFEIDDDNQLELSFRTSKSHLEFIYDLYLLKKTNNDLYADYVNFVSRDQLGLISRISWKEIKLSSYTVDVKSGGKVNKVKRHKTLIIPKIQIGSSYITFNQLSEGTFKTLALIFYVMTDASSCLLIEEPEVCVHHGLLTKIISTIKAYAGTKQVMFSTHSDLVLDTLSHENVHVVQLNNKGTVVNKLSKWAGSKGIAALNAYLEETGTLGEYWRNGGFVQ